MLSSKKKIFIVWWVCLLGYSAFGQCPTLTNPRPNAFNVPVDATLRWTSPASEFTTFVISIGTTLGGTNLLNRRTSGIISSYKPELGLPEESDIYVNIILIREDQSSIQCNYQFSTKILEELPDCAPLSEPLNGKIGIPVNTAIKWEYAARATGYRISVGTTPKGTDIENNKNLGNRLNYTPPGYLPENQKIYVTLIPYNRLGDALNCSESVFTTASSTIDCEPQRPRITSIPNTLGLCQDIGFLDLRVREFADEYRWYQMAMGDRELPLGSGDSLRIAEIGIYRLVAWNKVGSLDEFITCETIVDFEVIEVGDPIISDIEVNRDANGLNIHVITAGSINYEFALDALGPYQDSGYFFQLPVQSYSVYVRDPFGCGLTSQDVARKLSAADFPAFFTPNEDGINDSWKYDPPPDLPDAFLDYIQIFDRYGQLQAHVNPEIGWDGRNTNGQPVQPSVYWFKAVSLTREIIHGYFALKR
ncbi:MAG: hypothetical protein RLZZ241_1306 [Bacteroidota bacterium]|jgi:gliding motility-associated-like protein